MWELGSLMEIQRRMKAEKNQSKENPNTRFSVQTENKLMERKEEEEEEEEEDIVCLHESFFINDDYQLTKFTFGSQVLELLCLQSASTDFDLMGQLVWPGAILLNDYLSKNVEIIRGCSIIELGSGVGVTGILCSRFCREIVLTDHNEEVLKILRKNIELHESSNKSNSSAGITAEKLEWGDSAQLNQILHSHPGRFDLVLGAGISTFRNLCSDAIDEKSTQQYVSFQQSSIPLLFDAVENLLQVCGKDHCKFVLGYVSRAKVMDVRLTSEALKHGLQINEIAGSRAVVGNLEGVIYEITL